MRDEVVDLVQKGKKEVALNLIIGTLTLKGDSVHFKSNSIIDHGTSQ